MIRGSKGWTRLATVLQSEHNSRIDEVRMTEHNRDSFEANAGKGMAHDSAMKDSRLPDKPWKYNPPPPAGVVRPKPVLVPKGK